MTDKRPEVEIPKEEMIPINVNPDGTGSYRMGYRPDEESLSPEADQNSIPEINVVVEQAKPGRFMRRVKAVGVIGLVGAVGVAGLQVKNWIEDIGNPFDSKSSHKVDLSIGAPKSGVFHEVYLNLGKITSTRSVSLDTSLDRGGILGFSNCDTRTRHTGKKDEDPKITSTTHAGIVIGSLSVRRKGEHVTAEASGDFTMTNPSVDFKDTVIDVHGPTGGMDACVGAHELTSARHIVDVAVQESGKVAASCAIQNEAGRQVFEDGIRSFVANTDLAKGLSAEELRNMSVTIDNYGVAAEAMYGRSVQEFRQEVDSVIKDYLKETDDHDAPKINDRDLLDCSKHKISVGDDGQQPK